MSKKLNKSGSGGGTPNNTLFKYFARSPAAEKPKIPKTPSVEEAKTEVKTGKLPTSPIVERASKRKLEDELKTMEPMAVGEEAENDKHIAEPEKVVVRHKQKKIRRILDSDDDEEELQIKASNANGDEDYKPSSEDEEEKEQSISSDASNSEGAAHRKKSKKGEHESVPKKAKLDSSAASGSFMEKLKQLQESTQSSIATNGNDAKYEKIVCSSSTLDEPVVWPHQKLEFLQPHKIKDKHGRRPEHTDYDASTLHVPESFLNTLSPGVRQWWLLKSDNFDCVLFFKVGKFYELYHMDADVGVKELGFTYMRGEFAHAGSPEVSFDKMSSALVNRGYKVARVEQTETPDMMAERCKQTKPTKFDRVVKREICQITNRGTQVFGSQCQITPHHQPNYMLAVVEKLSGNISRYGICYVDTSIGDFYVGEFDDDKNGSRLLTLLSHHMPVLVLSEKGSLSERTLEIWRTMLAGALKESLPANGPKACSAELTLKHLAEKYYATSASADNWPLVLRSMQADSDHLGLTPATGYTLALKALGQCIAYMQKCHVEEKVLPMARFHHYSPPDMLADAGSATPLPHARRQHMVLDSTTLANLRITGEEHTLQSTLDNCCTKFGKRLLHHWLCSPSCELQVIVERQRAISELLAHEAVLQEARALLAPLPDFERHLAQIHVFGNKQITQNHPDGRAIMFEEKLYNKKKMQNFLAILQGFETLMQIPQMFSECESALLKRITQLPGNGKDAGIFPDMSEQIAFFKNAFDHEAAAKTGVIAPELGVEADYDEVDLKIKEIDAALKAYLVEQEKYFGCRLNYFGADKKRFQLEVPESNARKAGKAYALEGQRKGNKPCKRFTTNETRNFLKQMQNAEEERNLILKDLARRIFEKFSNHYAVWKRCVDCVANLDVLGSLAEYARQQQVSCVPELLAPQQLHQSPFIDIAEGYHPCVPAETYIPNGIVLGTTNSAPLSILTGPNMGGKSTLMRQMGLLVVMAQIGAHVPAQHCRLSLVDRIFTRLGAQDDILAGHSTFLVELNETSLILKHATEHSLVLLDELGRGTATYDGTAIAASVVNYLADLKCRTLFSTHYHNLIDYFHKDARITLGHMACMVENEGTEDPTQETVTFLYKYTAGACPKSYGFNAAKLAGMPCHIIKRAYELSKRVEAIALRRKIASKIVAGGGASQTMIIKNLLAQLQSCHI